MSAYLLGEEEVRVKTLLWSEMNREYIEEMEMKQAMQQAARESAERALNAAVGLTRSHSLRSDARGDAKGAPAAVGRSGVASKSEEAATPAAVAAAAAATVLRRQHQQQQQQQQLQVSVTAPTLLGMAFCWAGECQCAALYCLTGKPKMHCCMQVGILARLPSWHLD